MSASRWKTSPGAMATSRQRTGSTSLVRLLCVTASALGASTFHATGNMRLASFSWCLDEPLAPSSRLMVLRPSLSSAPRPWPITLTHRLVEGGSNRTCCLTAAAADERRWHVLAIRENCERRSRLSGSVGLTGGYHTQEGRHESMVVGSARLRGVRHCCRFVQRDRTW